MAQAIADELADPDRRIHNTIIYNFLECTEYQAGNKAFVTVTQYIITL